MNTSLLAHRKVCCVCGCEARDRMRYRPLGDPNILAITPILYRRGQNKGDLKNAPRIQVCEPCLVKALTEGRLIWTSKEIQNLWHALRESILVRYSSMVSEDQNG
jgi:hypothetical protein